MPQAIRKLPANQVALVQSADRARIAAALSRVLPLNDERWFKQGNIYVPDASGRVEADSNTIPTTAEQDFVRYIGGSVFTHCADAWGFIGRALDALLRGDLPGAIHLTYYAELRAAISLLASEGIFIGNVDHFAVLATRVKQFGRQSNGKPGTHRFVWQALQAWTDGPRAQTLFGGIVRPGGEWFEDWVRALTSGASQAKISELFKLISLDLEEFDQDHRRRNTASYNPGRLRPQDLAVAETRDLIAEVWAALEPGPNGAFMVLDDLLLPELLLSIYKAVPRPGVIWSDWVERIAPASQAGTALLSELTTESQSRSSSGLIGAIYSSKSSETDPRVFFRPMLARTVLLVRLATGSAILLLRESGKTPLSLRPWIDSLASARGLWRPASPFSDPHDLWADVELALDEASVAGVDSLSELHAGLPTGVRTLGQGERVPVWSFT